MLCFLAVSAVGAICVPRLNELVAGGYCLVISSIFHRLISFLKTTGEVRAVVVGLPCLFFGGVSFCVVGDNAHGREGELISRCRTFSGSCTHLHLCLFV